MSNLRSWLPNRSNTFEQFTVGFDQFDNMMDEMAKMFDGVTITNYPPHNVIKVDDDHYVLEIAVSGFEKSDVSVATKNNQLTVTGKSNHKTNDKEVYLYRGLSKRDFTQTFYLTEFVSAQSATVVNGVLRIALERVLPEALKPRQIDVL